MVALPRTRPADTETWPVLTVDRLDHTSVRALLDNRAAAVRRPALLDRDACAASISALRTSDGWDSYDVDGPPTGKLGVSQYSYGDRREDYFAEARTALEQRARAVAGLPDPLRLVLEELAACWPAAVRIAVDGDQGYFAGVFRSGAGIRLHADWGPRDGPGWTIGSVVAQLAWNVYYTLPETGGELMVYDRPWTPDLEVDARQRFYDYNPDKVSGRRKVEILPEPGELVMFSSSNVHAVAEASSDGSRITASSFVGECPDGSLVLWS